MKDTLYQLMNNNATDLPPADSISNQEVKNIMKRFKEENRIHSTKERHKPRISMALLAAAATAACMGTAVAAATSFGGFWQTKNVWEQERTQTESDGNTISYSYEKFDHNNYEMLESNADELNAAANTEDISLSVENCYCDGINLICSLKAEIASMPDAEVLDTSVRLHIGGKTYTKSIFEDGTTVIELMMLKDKTEPDCYYGTLNFRLDESISEPQDIIIELTKLKGYTSAIYSDENKTGSIEESVSIMVPVNPQEDLCKMVNVDYASDLMKIRSVEYSPAGIGVTYQIPENSVIVLYDAEGNKIERQENHYLTNGEWITEFFSGSETSSVRIILKGKQEGNAGALDELTVPLS